MPRLQLIDITFCFVILKLYMSRSLSIIVVALFFIFQLYSPLIAAGFVLDINVPRVSKFQLIQFHKKIQHGRNVIGQFILENNTIDGYKLEVSSPKNGVLSPETMQDGIVSIPYVFSLEQQTGQVSTGVVINETPDLTLGIPINVLDCFGFQSDKTGVVYNVILTIDDPDNLLLMAGLYEESLSFTYTDY